MKRKLRGKFWTAYPAGDRAGFHALSAGGERLAYSSDPAVAARLEACANFCRFLSDETLETLAPQMRAQTSKGFGRGLRARKLIKLVVPARKTEFSEGTS